MITTQKQKFINYIMKGGKKHLARNLLEEAFTIIKERGNKEPEVLMEKAFENVINFINGNPTNIANPEII